MGAVVLETERSDLIERLNQVEYKLFEQSHCPKGGSHQICMEQLGDPRDTARTYNDPIYYMCIKCCQSYWPRSDEPFL